VLTRNKWRRIEKHEANQVKWAYVILAPCLCEAQATRLLSNVR
jgi:hypothetical protein